MSAVLVQAGAIALGASAGALLRWQAGLRCGVLVSGIPLGTLVVNVAGGLLIGLALVWFRLHPDQQVWRLLAVTGFLGGLTTFSTFSGETLTLLAGGRHGTALLHAGLHLLGALLAAAAGHAAGRWLWDA
ncbi:camphor resistance protein CrcB [Sphaerotilus hippei]|uniref:Fluoride-specific ion channel FluC n=1 Tax=Sphaerotilus hippei TaxID=744406 RepID=A0A318HBT5_9BURK|nr:fluoride efflux transporter CrcB [Sphaerotilus hippei]PXW98199.1 camphor resistance protein CrcB [Sphaerotilus hippei]